MRQRKLLEATVAQMVEDVTPTACYDSLPNEKKLALRLLGPHEVSVYVDGQLYAEGMDYRMFGQVINFNDPLREGSIIAVHVYYKHDGTFYIARHQLTVERDSSALDIYSLAGRD